ncbi:MAG: cytochrome c3 family protein [Blastocatellia bacterium]
MRDRKLKLAILLFMVGVGIYQALAAMTGAAASAETTQRAKRHGPAKRNETRKETRDYSHFKHAVAAHQQQACDACHKFPSANWKTVRKGDAAFPDITDYPQHASCLPCHRPQFFSGAVPTICSNCHTDPSPRNSTRFPFPSLRALFDASPKGKDAVSEYRVYFPHDKHESLFGVAPAERCDDAPRLVLAAYWQEKKAEAKKPEDKNAVCANCHQTYQPQGDSDDEYLTKPPKDLPETAFWLKKGVYKTSPPGHQACFSCHSEDMSPASKDCGVCHKLMPAAYVAMQRQPHADFDSKLAAVMGISDRTDLDKWSRREAGKFRHEWFSHAELSCQDCHKVAAINTTDPKGPTVAVLSCGGTGSGCHVTPSAADGGALNLEAEQKKASPAFQCTKCHVQLGKQPVPESHLKAIAAMKDKK